MERGDIFHDGLLGYWIIHEKPNGKKLFCVPLEKLIKKHKPGDCDYFHDLKNWNFEGIKAVCNLYKDKSKAKKIIGKGNYLYEEFMNFAKI